MVEDTVYSLAISLCSVFVVTFVLGGFDIKTAIVTTFTIILILVSLLPKREQAKLSHSFLGNDFFFVLGQFNGHDVLVVSNTKCYFFGKFGYGKWYKCGILLAYY